MSTKNQEAALDVIGKKLKLKEEIDHPFDENELKNQEQEIEESNEKEVQKCISYKLRSKDAGFNCLCELNLGKAFKYTKTMNDDESFTETRTKYPNSYKQAMNEKWLDYTLEQIKNATNPIVVISDIFSRVTTGNNEETLPYKEQLLYIYKKLNDEKIKNKIVALTRGIKEQEIINNGGPDLMDKLANMLGMQNKLVDAGFQLSITINNINTKNDRQISLLHFGKKINSVRTLAISMQKYANENPGHDIYFCTNSKTNWYASGVTTAKDKDGNIIQKPCWFIAFGTMYEYDKVNEKRPEIGPYTLNKDWYKISIYEDGFVRADRVNYIYPHPTKIDSSNYTASVLTEDMENKFKELLSMSQPAFEKMMEKLKNKTRKQIVSTMHNTETLAKNQSNKKDNVEEEKQTPNSKNTKKLNDEEEQQL